jgi:RNA polymerase sigma factor (sigma-70 family)
MNSVAIRSADQSLRESRDRACLVASALMTAPPSSLIRLFETEEGPLLHFALGLVGRRSVAEELVQEAFLRLHQVREEVENPRAWLYRSVRNLAINHLRDHRKETDLEDADRTSTEADLPAQKMGRQEAIGLVRMLLAELPESDRDLIRLKYQEDLKYQDIGQRTGINVGNVGYRLHHLLKGLAESLRHAGIESSEG